MQPLRIALVQYSDARSIRSWSGTTYFSKLAMERHVGNVVDLSPTPFSLLPYRVGARAVRLMTGKQHAFNQDVVFARRVGKHFSKILADTDYDLIFSPAGSSTIAFLETDIPIIYYTDATWRAVQDYYACYSNVSRRMAGGGEEIERRALGATSLALFSSDWARNSAINDYGVDPVKAHTVYIGANLPNPPAREQLPAHRVDGPICLLMVGVSWEIKGGEVAYRTLLNLLDRGYDAELTVVGCNAPKGISHPRLRVIPFLDKSIQSDRELFESCWHRASFFILPSRFEAAGVVFCEASAHALPSLGPRTGGVPSLIRDGTNGFTLPADSTGEDYATQIIELIDAPERYASLCESSRNEYESRLNWDSWGKRVATIIGNTFPHLKARVGAPRKEG